MRHLSLGRRQAHTALHSFVSAGHDKLIDVANESHVRRHLGPSIPRQDQHAASASQPTAACYGDSERAQFGGCFDFLQQEGGASKTVEDTQTGRLTFSPDGDSGSRQSGSADIPMQGLHSTEQIDTQAGVPGSSRNELSDEVLIALLRREEILQWAEIRYTEFALISHKKQLASLQTQMRQVSYMQLQPCLHATT